VSISSHLHLRRQINTATLDLAVQEVSIRGEQCRCESEDTGKGLGSLSALFGSGSKRLVGRVNTWQDDVKEFTAAVVLVCAGDFHLLLALGSVVVHGFASLRDFGGVVVVIVVVLVFIYLGAVNACSVNKRGVRVGKCSLVQEFGLVHSGVDSGCAVHVGEDTKEDGETVLVTAVGSNKVLLGIAVFVDSLFGTLGIVLVEFDLC
jgi:hypothetical protein